MSDIILVRGDATQRWSVDDNSLDSIVTDPPYGIGFMGKKWDDKGGPQAYQAWTSEWASEAYRALKPGGFLLAFGATRMSHRMACGFEDAGFEIVDTIEWLYLSGMPFGARTMGNGWKTRLKPAHEPIIVARKRLEGTCSTNMRHYGVGAFNIDGCRIPYAGEADIAQLRAKQNRSVESRSYKSSSTRRMVYETQTEVKDFAGNGGRFPANVVTLDGDAWFSPYFNVTPQELSKKASPSEKRGGGWENDHPTIKPVELIRWLQRLVTPLGGRTASPFLGSGTDAVAAILEGFDFYGIEMNDEYWSIINARVEEAGRAS